MATRLSSQTESYGKLGKGGGENLPWTKKLYFGNLPYQVSDHAEIVSIQIPRNQQADHPREFAFIELAEESANAVISAFHGRILHGRTLTVNKAS